MVKPLPELPFRVAVICTGNICRSPMAEVSLRHLVAQDGFLAERVEITSAGTARWHIGNPMDARARAALDRAGLTGEGSLASYADSTYLNAHHLIVAMTREHLRDVHQRLSNPKTSVVLLRNLLEPGLDLDVADPYYGDGEEFDECLELLTRGGRRLKEELRQQLGADSLEV